MKRGDLIEFPDEAPDYLPMIHKGGQYTVSKVDDAGEGVTYVTILADDNQGHALLADMFRPVRDLDNEPCNGGYVRSDDPCKVCGAPLSKKCRAQFRS